MSDVERYDAMGAIVSADDNGYYIKASVYDALAERYDAAIVALRNIADGTYSGLCSGEEDCCCAECMARAVLKEQP